MVMIPLLFLIALLAMPLLCFGSSIIAPASREISSGVFLSEWNLPGPVVIDVLEFDLSNRDYTIEMEFAHGKRNFAHRQPTSRIAAQRDDVVAAVNCSFFTAGIGISGLLSSNSNLIASPAPDSIRETWALQGSGKSWGVQKVVSSSASVRFLDSSGMDIDVLNNVRSPGKLALYTPVWGASTQSVTQGVEIVVEGVNYPMRSNKLMRGTITAVRKGQHSLNNPISEDGFILAACGSGADELISHATTGECVEVCFNLYPMRLNNAMTMCSGVKWLVKDGAPFQSTGTVLHPRTVVAWSGTRHWFITIDGRQPRYSIGASMGDMADFLVNMLHVENAINLDGGGSSSMVVDGLVVNSPSDGAKPAGTGKERPVPNALLLIKRDAVSRSVLRDDFTESGRALPWDEKFNCNPVVACQASCPGGDGYALKVLNRCMDYETVSIGEYGDTDYAVEAWVYCDYRPDVAVDGFERVGIFARDGGNGNFDSAQLGGGNCYALAFDSHDGRIRAALLRDGKLTDFCQSAPVARTASAWRLFRIECRRQRVRYLLDGKEIAEINDNTHRSGRAGIGYHEYFSNDENRRGAIIESFRMTPLSAN
jgi:Phosphodiester glycosidase